jgi:hypothetical protein
MTRTSPRSRLRLTSRRTCRSPKLLLTSSRVRSARAEPDPDCWAAVLLLVMATLSLHPGNTLVIRVCRANKEHHLVAHYEFPMSLPYHMRTGRPHDTRSQGYIVAAMLVAANAGMMRSVWRKGGETSNWPALIISPGGNYQLPITGIAAAGRNGYGPNGLAVCPRTTPRTGITGRKSPRPTAPRPSILHTTPALPPPELGRCAVGTALTCPTAHRPSRVGFRYRWCGWDLVWAVRWARCGGGSASRIPGRRRR